MHNLDLILTLAGGFTAALVLGYFTQRIGFSPIVGYLVAGTLVGPHTPGFVADASIAEQLAEVGVILLMFGVGLQFHIEELLAVRGVAVPGAVAQSAVATVFGAVIARWFGWSWPAGIVFGMALAVASTVVLIRVLSDHRDLHTTTGHIAVGWLAVEDLFTVLALVLLPVLFADGGSETSLFSAPGVTALKVAALVVFTIVVGIRVIPYVLDHIADTGSRELFTLTVLTLALGIAVGSARSIISIVLNPLLYRTVPRLEKWVSAHEGLSKLLNPPVVDHEMGGRRRARPADRRRRAVVVGYGPTGRTVVPLLRDNGIQPTVVELNMESVRELRDQGVDAIYGDVTQRNTLDAAGIANVDSLILTSAGMGNADPRIYVLARAQYLRDLPDLLKAGADQVFTGEGEVALSLTESILDRPGATPEQMDRERVRAHRELFGKQPADAASNA